MIPAWLAFFDGLIAIVLVGAGLTAAHFGLASAFFGFQLYLLGLLLGLVGAILAVIGFVTTSRPEQLGAHRRATVALLSCGVVAVLAIYSVAHSWGYPPINDISTDLDNPPEFTHAGQLPANAHRDLKYDKAKYAERQSQGYGDLSAILMILPPAEAFETVKSQASQMPDWTITYSDPNSMIVEGYSTSKLFRFQDDFVIQIRPHEGHALVEMRSKSRDGIGDSGVNAARIRAFFAKLQPDQSEI